MRRDIPLGGVFSAQEHLTSQPLPIMTVRTILCYSAIGLALCACDAKKAETLTTTNTTVSVPASGVAAGELEALVNKLNQAVEKEADEKKRRLGDRAAVENSKLYQFWNQASQAAVADRNQAEEMATVLKHFSDSPEVRSLCDELITLVKKIRDQKDEGFVAEVDGAIRRAVHAIPQAASDRDLDKVLQDLVRLSVAHHHWQSILSQRAARRASQAASFVTTWQEYLIARQNRNEQAVINHLTTLANHETPLVMKEEILARKPKPTPAAGRAEVTSGGRVEEVIAGVQNLDQTRAAIDQLNRMRATGVPVDESLLSALSWIAATYEAHKAGLLMELPTDRGSHGRVPHLTSQLLLTVLPDLLGSSTRPGPAETVHDYLQRLVREAKEAKQWQVVLRAMEAKSALGGSSARMHDLAPLRTFIQAQNQEQARQYALAVASYQASLADVTGTVPVNFVGERLSAIQSAHPVDYESGLKYRTRRAGE